MEEKKKTLDRIFHTLTNKLKRRKNKLSSGKEDSRELSKTSRLSIYSDSLFFILYIFFFIFFGYEHELYCLFWFVVSHERLNISLGEINRTWCQFYLIFINKSLQFSILYAYVLVGWTYFLFAIGKLSRKIRFNWIKLRRGNLIELGIVRTNLDATRIGRWLVI